jgi:hypothetical protein
VADVTARLNETPEWAALVAHAATVQGTHLRDLFAADDKRGHRLALELDVGSKIGSGWEVSVGAIGYYGWMFPRDGESSNGATLGLAGYGERGRIKLLAEYDLSSDFLGEDSYSVAGSFRLTPDSSNPELSVRGGWEKGDIFSLRLQLGVLHNKPRPARLSNRQGRVR